VSFVQERLNSADRLERYTGILCIGRYSHRGRRHKWLARLRNEVCPAFFDGELISDVSA